jgi:DNA-cytosine methyltransferase
MMKHLGLFEGIGGFSLAARWMGWETVAWCEINEDNQKVLKYHFPDAEGFSDIKTTDFKKYANRIDILTGGFPCQPYSVSGKRKGKEDDRHLWPEMLRAIREISPRWVVGENVRGLTNWNGGLVFDEVQADLEAQGFKVLPVLLPSCSVNAPDLRERIWFIAYSPSNIKPLSVQSTNNEIKNVWEWDSEIWSQNWKQPEMASGLHSFLIQRVDRSRINGSDNGISARLDPAAVINAYRSSLFAYGNSINPLVVHRIYKAIEQYELTPFT